MLANLAGQAAAADASHCPAACPAAVADVAEGSSAMPHGGHECARRRSAHAGCGCGMIAPRGFILRTREEPKKHDEPLGARRQTRGD